MTTPGLELNGAGGGGLERGAFKGPFPRSTTALKVLAAMLDYDLAVWDLM